MAAKSAELVKITIEATLPLPEKQSQATPLKKSCSACGRSGKASCPLSQAAEILMKLATGQYTPEQAEGIPEVIESLLRRHYGK